MAEDKSLKFNKIPLSGKWIPRQDPVTIGPGDFATLTNMRYEPNHIRSVSGMTKINTSVINATNLIPKSAYHYKKDRPAESHLLVQSYDSSGVTYKVYENTTAIPSQGNFTATQVWSDTSGGTTGRFSKTPDDAVAYCNGKDSCFYAGSEHRVSQFINFDPIQYEFENDFTDNVNNALSTSGNIATLKRTSNGDQIDSDDTLILHLDNNVTDSSTANVKTVTSGTIAYSTTTKKFGTHSGTFVSAESDELTVDYHTDFTSFSNGNWTVDMWIYPTNITDSQGLVGQYHDGTNSFLIYLFANGAIYCVGKNDSVTMTTYCSTAQNVLTAAAWNHVFISESGNEYRIYVNGVLRGYKYSTDRIVAMTENITIGYAMYVNGVTEYFFDGNIDEVRFSKVARDGRTVPTLAYGQATAYYTYCDVCSILPIDRIKFYVGTANASAATATVYYWSGTAWTSVSSLSDGTATAGKTLAKTGTMTFTSTTTTAKLSYRYGTVGYHYRVIFSGMDDNVTVSQVTIGIPFQSIKDLWTGIYQPVSSFLLNGSTNGDYYAQVYTEDFDSSLASTFAPISSMTTTDFIYAGFLEPVQGILFKMGGTYTNSNICSASIYYWSGSAWTAVDGKIDYTAGDNAFPSFGQTGAISWTPPTTESKRSIDGSGQYYYYKITVNATLDASVYIDYVAGIYAPKNINGYSFPIFWQDRLFLLCEYEGRKNRILGSSLESALGFNGLDSLDYELGDGSAVLAAGTLYTRFGEGIYDNLVVHKANGEIWIIDGFAPESYKFYKVSDSGSTNAPGTVKRCDMGYEISQGTRTHVSVWQAQKTIMLFDGNTIIDIGQDISNFFDANKSECIRSGYEHLSEAFYDQERQEYHWLFVSGTSATSINYELVFDLVLQKWFRIDRGAGKYLCLGLSVQDTSHKVYTLGAIATGYVERLEYGTTFDSTSITSTFKTGDISFSGDAIETNVRRIKHVSAAKATTTQSATMTHYGDGITTSTDTTSSFSLKSATHRIVKTVNSHNWGNNIYHSFNSTVTIDDENIGYEPLFLVVGVKDVREDLI